MKIWKQEINLFEINQRGLNTLAEHLDIKFIGIGDDYLKATMPVDHRTKQPIGLLHGGASCVLAETIGSTAANYAVDEKYYCVGLDINANHMQAAHQGLVTGITRPLHIGKTTHVWQIEIFNETNKMICISRLTMMVIEK